MKLGPLIAIDYSLLLFWPQRCVLTKSVYVAVWIKLRESTAAAFCGKLLLGLLALR